MDLATGILSFDGDIARKGFHIRRSLEQLQKWHTNIEKVNPTLNSFTLVQYQ